MLSSLLCSFNDDCGYMCRCVSLFESVCSHAYTHFMRIDVCVVVFFFHTTSCSELFTICFSLHILKSFQWMAVNNINTILDTKPDAVLIGPYDLSASFGITGQFDSYAFKEIVKHVKESCIKKKIPVGIHEVQPDLKELEERKEEGYTFLPYTIDSVVLSKHYNITDNHKSFL